MPGPGSGSGSSPAPGPEVVAAFGLGWAEPQLLDGGQGRTWRLGDVVFKPVDNAMEHAWVSEVLAAWGDDASVRVPAPIAPRHGGWAWRGWSAHRYVAGTPLAMGTDAVLIRRAADAFHTRLADLPKPAFLLSRDDAWAFGDRVAWEGVPALGSPETRTLVEAAMSAYRPVRSRSQLVHGDLAGNVLSAPDLPPAVIDWPPYWRPPGWAVAVAVVDGLAWYDAAPSLLDEWADIPEWGQLLLRAFVYRVATVGRNEHDGLARLDPAAHEARMQPLLTRLLQYVGTS